MWTTAEEAAHLPPECAKDFRDEAQCMQRLLSLPLCDGCGSPQSRDRLYSCQFSKPRDLARTHHIEARFEFLNRRFSSNDRGAAPSRWAQNRNRISLFKPRGLRNEGSVSRSVDLRMSMKTVASICDWPNTVASISDRCQCQAAGSGGRRRPPRQLIDRSISNRATTKKGGHRMFSVAAQVVLNSIQINSTQLGRSLEVDLQSELDFT